MKLLQLISSITLAFSAVAGLSSCIETVATPVYKDQDGNVLNGNVVSYTDTIYMIEFYDGTEDKPDLIKDEICNIEKVYYNDNGKIAKEESIVGRKLRAATMYTYDDKGLLLSIRTESYFGIVKFTETQYAYDKGKLVKKHTKEGREDEDSIIYTDEDSVVFSYDGDRLTNEVFYIYQTDKDSVVEYERDVYQYHEDGSYEVYRYNKEADAIFIGSWYDKNGKILKKICGGTTTYEYDPNSGLLTKEHYVEGSSAKDMSFTYVYDEKGNWREKIVHDPDGLDVMRRTKTKRYIEYAK